MTDAPDITGMLRDAIHDAMTEEKLNSKLKDMRIRELETETGEKSWIKQWTAPAVVILIVGAILTQWLATRDNISELKISIANLRDQVAADEKAANDRVLKYIPSIESQARLNDVQDLRLQNLVQALDSQKSSTVELGKAIADIAKSVGTMHDDLLIMKRDKQGKVDLPNLPYKVGEGSPGR